MTYVLAVGAALSNALTTIFQRKGVESAPARDELRLSLITYALRQKVWLLGFLFMIAGFLFQAGALDLGELSSVQPVLTLELPFLIVLLAVWFGHHPGWSDWIGSIVSAAALATFLVLASPKAGRVQPGLHAWGEVSFACLAGIAVLVALTRTGPPTWRAGVFGAASAVAFALTAAYIKAATQLLGEGCAADFRNSPLSITEIPQVSSWAMSLG